MIHSHLYHYLFLPWGQTALHFPATRSWSVFVFFQDHLCIRFHLNICSFNMLCFKEGKFPWSLSTATCINEIILHFSTDHQSPTCQFPLNITTNVYVFIHLICLPLIYAGHGPLPQLTGNVTEVLVSSLLQSCYHSSQTLPRVYQHYGPSPIQPLSSEMQILLTVYYLVQLGQFKSVL